MTKQTIRSAVIVAVLACGALAACNGNSPTQAVPGTAGPSYDGGMGYGSGNRTQDGDETTTTTSTGGAASDTTGRGGMGYGSGN